jgi:hypothetical protein
MDTKTFLSHCDNIYYGFLGISNTEHGLGEDYWKFKEKHPESIASELCMGSVVDKSNLPYKDSTENTRGKSRARNHAAWLSEMESEGWYCPEGIAKRLNVDVEKVEYAAEKNRLPFTKMRARSITVYTKMIKLEDAVEWLRLTRVHEDALKNKGNLVWKNNVFNQKNRIKYSESMNEVT